MKTKRLPVLAVAFLVIFGRVSLCEASIYTVLNLNDSGAGSLRQAILTATNGDSIVFSNGLSGTITLTSGVLTITNSISILGRDPKS